MVKKRVIKKKKPADLSGLVDFISNKFDDTEERFDDLKKMFRDLQGSVDFYAKRADSYFQEMVLLSRQMDRHEKWIRKIAEKIGVKLES